VRRLFILAALALRCAAQFAPPPQAKSPDEFDSYLDVLDAPTPTAVIPAAETFLRSWPASGLRGHVYEREFEAYRRLGDSVRAIEAGESSLAAAPDNLLMLANLSVVLANGTSDPSRLARSGEYARKAIALSKSIRLPRSISPSEWTQIEARVNSQAHAALGLVANQRGDVTGAIREFETAISLGPEPDATQYLRLGMLYRAAGNLNGAREKLERAAKSDEPAIRELATRELARIGQR
jgi:tetratricopeptide (TPR) repeat protein